MSDERTDFDLVVAARSGDRGAFAILLKRHSPKLLALARQIVGSDAAEDVMQEAALDAYRGLDSFAGRSAVRTWLYRITLNRSLGERRRRRPEPVESEPLDLLRRWEDPDYTVDPAVVAARRADADVLRAILDDLPEAYRVALILHDAQASPPPSWPRCRTSPWAPRSRTSVEAGWPWCRGWPRTTTDCWRA